MTSTLDFDLDFVTMAVTEDAIEYDGQPARETLGSARLSSRADCC